MKAKHIAMTVAFAGSAWLAFVADKTPTAGIAEPIDRASSISQNAVPTNSPPGGDNPPSTYNSASEKVVAKGQPTIDEVIDRAQLIGGEFDRRDVGGTKERVFASHNWTPPPPPPTKIVAPLPTAPPLPFVYMGKKLDSNRWEVYLLRGDQVVVVQEKSLLDGTYRVESIRPPMLTVTYLPLNQTQTLTIGGTD